METSKERGQYTWLNDNALESTEWIYILWPDTLGLFIGSWIQNSSNKTSLKSTAMARIVKKSVIFGKQRKAFRYSKTKLNMNSIWIVVQGPKAKSSPLPFFS